MRASLLHLAPPALALGLLLGGCPARYPRTDAGMPDGAVGDDSGLPDGGIVDGGMVDAGPSDGGVDAGPSDGGRPDSGRPDAGPLPTESIEAPPAEVVRNGAGGFLLRGTVLTPTGPLEGEVLVVGNTITCVAADCSASPMAGAVTVIDTHAVISPGLIDAHNHLSYDFLPEWVPDGMALFANRYEWRSNAAYRAHVEPEGKLESWKLPGCTASSGCADSERNRQHMCAALRWGELRALVHGTTTVMGQSPNRTCVQGLVRNADHHHGLGTNRMRTTIAGACETSLNDSARTSLVNAFRSGAATRHAIHMGEGHSGGGVATDPTRELDCYAGRHRATTSLLRDTDGRPFGAGLFIHSVPFDDEDLMESMMAGVRLVWSPSSNVLLYGRTAPIGRILDLGVPVALGPDWTVSGEDELLSEMRFALTWAAAEDVPQVTSESLVRMATEGGAEAVDLAASIGQIAVGRRADITVFGRLADDPHVAVTDSRARDVRLVMIDGAAYYGDLALEGATAVNGSCDMLDACGTPKFLCAANTTAATTPGAETVEEIETFLRAYLDGGWRDGEEMRPFVLRGSDLAPLVDCDL